MPQGKQLARGGGEARGTLQADLVAALRRCPSGAMVAADAAALAAQPSVLPVLINALSERGHLTADGQQVSTSGMLLVVTVAAPPAVMATARDEDTFKSAAKAHFVAVVGHGGEAGSEANLPGGQGNEARELAEVLRRRLDFVAPLRHLEPETA